MSPAVSGLWRDGRCEAGHDLTADGAWLYRSDGSRVCRPCAIIRRGGDPAKRQVRTDDGIGSWRS